MNRTTTPTVQSQTEGQQMLRSLMSRIEAALEAERAEAGRSAIRQAELIVMQADITKLAKMAGAA